MRYTWRILVFNSYSTCRNRKTSSCRSKVKERQIESQDALFQLQGCAQDKKSATNPECGRRQEAATAFTSSTCEQTKCKLPHHGSNDKDGRYHPTGSRRVGMTNAVVVQHDQTTKAQE